MRNWRFIKALGYAVEGVSYAIRTQPNMRFHVFAAVVVLIIGGVLLRTPVEWALIILAIGFVWVTELLNTSIEAMVDLLSPEIRERAKVAKDVAAGAVLVASMVAVGVGGVVFGARLGGVFEFVVERTRGF